MDCLVGIIGYAVYKPYRSYKRTIDLGGIIGIAIYKPYKSYKKTIGLV